MPVWKRVRPKPTDPLSTVIKVHKRYFNRRILLSKCSFYPKALTVHTGEITEALVSSKQQPFVKKHPKTPQTLVEV